MSVVTDNGVGEILTGINNQIEERSSNTRMYSFIIDHTASQDDMIEYADDTGCEAKSTEWLGLLGIRPCVYNNGEVLYYLDPDDFNKKADGTTSDLTTLGNDVMIEIPKMGVKGVWISREKIKITLTTARHARDFDYSAFSDRAYNDADYLYVGVYPSYVENNRMYSSKGRTITTNLSISAYRNAARSRGIGYHAVSYAVDELLTVIYCLIARHINSQETIGPGYFAGNDGSPLPTGGSEEYGMLNQLAGPDSTQHIKFLGIEDLWGNTFQLEDGLIKTSGIECTIRRYKTHSDIGSLNTGDVEVGRIVYESNVYQTSLCQGYISEIYGSTGAIFLPVKFDGSDDYYYTDYANINMDIVATPRFGGDFTVLSTNGIFYRDFSHNDSETIGTGGEYCSSRLIAFK